MKRMLLSIAAVILCLIAPALPAGAQTSLHIHPDQGAGVLSENPASGERWSTSTFPFGNYVGPTSGEDIFCRTYLRFPLDGVPADSTIQSATLYVYVDDFWPEPGSAPMSVYPVTAADWPEGDAWNDIGNWPALGGAVVTAVVTSEGGWFAWDVTSLADGWLSGAPNHGLAVAAADLDSTASNWAAARRLTADDPATRPYLEVSYLEPTPTPPPPTSTPQPPPPTSTSKPPPPPTATPPTATPTVEPILMPATGRMEGALKPLLALVGLALLTAGLGLGHRTR